jgi:mRNA interferase MazF
VRGDIYRLRAPRNVSGHEQKGQRYGVVVQSDRLPLTTLIVAPTSTSARASMFRPKIEMDGIKTLVLLDQITAVNPERLGDFAGRLDTAELRELDRALLGVLGLF